MVREVAVVGAGMIKFGELFNKGIDNMISIIVIDEY